MHNLQAVTVSQNYPVIHSNSPGKLGKNVEIIHNELKLGRYVKNLVLINVSKVLINPAGALPAI